MMEKVVLTGWRVVLTGLLVLGKEVQALVVLMHMGLLVLVIKDIDQILVTLTGLLVLGIEVQALVVLMHMG
jgi:hypothetical protein